MLGRRHSGGGGLKSGLCSQVPSPGQSFSLSFLVFKTGPTALLAAEALRMEPRHELPRVRPLGGEQENKVPFLQGPHCLLTVIKWETPKGHLLFLLISPGSPVKQKEKATRRPAATAEEASSSSCLPLFFFSNYLSRNIWYHERALHTQGGSVHTGPSTAGSQFQQEFRCQFDNCESTCAELDFLKRCWGKLYRKQLLASSPKF